MPVNRNALIRYKTIDNCLRNRYRKWTLDDLIDACSDALYEFEGIEDGVSKRTIQLDIQTMRSEKLGYNAPIIVVDRKYYTYDDPDYSITNIPLTDQDLGKLTEVVDILRQFKGFNHFKDLSGMIQRLEDKVQSTKSNTRSIIDLEKNEALKGLDFIDPIYQAILQKKCLEITYQSFKARKENTLTFHPFLLKEHRNRWFVLGNTKKQKMLLLALDRIIELKSIEKPLMNFDENRITNYFKDVIGVTVNEGQNPIDVRFLVTPENAPYVSTKPLHHSQIIVEESEEGTVFQITVQHNFELERDLLSFGDRIKVLGPSKLRSIIKERLQNSIDFYETEINPKTLKNYPQRLYNKGYILASQIYTSKQIKAIKKSINKHIDASDNGEIFAIRGLFNNIPHLKNLCFTPNLLKILKAFGDHYFLCKAIYFNKPPDNNWYVTWHQDLAINVSEKKDISDFHGWTTKEDTISVIPPIEIRENTISIRIHLDDSNEKNGTLKLIPGSHKKAHLDDEIQHITQNTLPTYTKANKGDVLLLSPLTIHASEKNTLQKPRRVIHLEFSNKELPEPLKYNERIDLFKK